MRFKLVNYEFTERDLDVIYLVFWSWDDYGYSTSFGAYCIDETGNRIEIGSLKIGCRNLTKLVTPTKSRNDYNSYSIKSLIPDGYFNKLPDGFFSLGQDISYYKKINEIFNRNPEQYYKAMYDLAYDIKKFDEMYNNNVGILVTSLMRGLHYPVVQQFSRVINGYSELTPYSFEFNFNDEKITVDVKPNSKPPSNIQVLIGRNGVGKTWLLYNIINQLIKNNSFNIPFEPSIKYKINEDFKINCPKNSFSSIIGLSFSIFDDALALDIDREFLEKTREDKHNEVINSFSKKYKYIGLVSKNQKDGKIKTKSIDDLKKEFRETLTRIKKRKNKIDLYLETCKNLNTDTMFSENGFIDLLEIYFNMAELENSNDDNMELKNVMNNFSRLSSGHMIIILSLTLLAESIYEKTIVVIDEPETHLHPPLLSTYIRALSFMLTKKNALAIIATHSPIVLQEVPKKCVTRVERINRDMYFSPIAIESFATNIDSLTREVFALEINKTGFYRLIEEELEFDFETTLEKFGYNIGSLGQILIQSLLASGDKKYEKD